MPRDLVNIKKSKNPKKVWIQLTPPTHPSIQNSHDVTYTSQLIMQKELLFNISCKIAYVSIVCFVILICIIMI